ncbi:predicted protein [Enterococcus faecalis HIP11704]|nr:predicted protein [Enterococcus faecalis HIP11704]
MGWIFNTSVVKKHPVLPRNSMPNNEKMKRPDLKATLLLHSGGTVPDSHWLPFIFFIKYSFNLSEIYHKFFRKATVYNPSSLILWKTISLRS